MPAVNYMEQFILCRVLVKRKTFNWENKLCSAVIIKYIVHNVHNINLQSFQHVSDYYEIVQIDFAIAHI